MMDKNTETAKKISSAHASALVERLSPKVAYKPYPKGFRFALNTMQQSKIYIIRTGIISVHRQPDDILLRIIEAPTLRGIMHNHLAEFRAGTEYTIKVVEPAELATLEYSDFQQMLYELNCWDLYAKYLELNLSVAVDNIFTLMLPTAYETVRMQLFELMSEPQSVRINVTVEEYIRSKTRMSRSRIMQILAELRTAGYIKTERGILLEIIHLPKSY